MISGHALPLAVLACLFAGSVLIIGRGQGWRCLAMLVWFPLLLFAMGWSATAGGLPLLPVVLLGGLAALACQTLFLLGAGVSGRRAFVGACGGYLAAVIVATVSVYFFRITGIYSPVMRDLWYAPGTGNLAFHWLTLGGIALAGAGLIADLAVAVSATIEEVHQANPTLAARDLFAAGMRFGRDVIGTEVITLPLAVLGSSLGGILLLLVQPDVARWAYSWMIFTNRQETAVEIIALAAGTIALVLTIPLTALLVSRTLGRTCLAEARVTRRGPSKGLPFFAPYLLLGVLVAVFALLSFRLKGTSYRYPASGRGAQASLVRGNAVSAQPLVSPWAKREKARGAEAMQMLTVRLSDAETLDVENPLTGSPVSDRIPQVGDRVIVRVQRSGDEVYGALSEMERDRGLLILLLGTAATVVLVARWQAWRALAALAASVVVIAAFLATMVRWQIPPLPATLLCSLIVTGLTYLILCGWTQKALCASAGTLIGLAVAGVTALLFGAWLNLSGRHDGDLLTLGLYSAGRSLDFQALLGAAALIGALGVVMDVAIAVASAVGEVRRADPGLGFTGLLAAGFGVGRKVMAAMFGALLFAYVGLNLGLFLLPWAGTGSSAQALGNERVVTEVFRLLVGGLAIVWAIPATALVSAWLASRRSLSLKLGVGGTLAARKRDERHL